MEFAHSQSQQPPMTMSAIELDEISDLLQALSSHDELGAQDQSTSNIWMGLPTSNQNRINNDRLTHTHRHRQFPDVTIPYINSVGGGDGADNPCEGCLNLEVNLEANKVEILFLKEDNQTKDAKISELIAKVGCLEAEIKAQHELEELRMDNLILDEVADVGKRDHDHNRTNSLLEKLYSAAGTVLKGLGGNVPPLDLVLEEEGINFTLSPMSVENLCRDLHSKFLVWQENHKMMHVELEKTLRIVEGLEEADSPRCNQAGADLPIMSPSSSLHEEDSNNDHDEMESLSGEPLCSISSTFSLSKPGSVSDHHQGHREDKDGTTRRNPLRKCRLGIGSYSETSACEDHLSEVFEIACDNCDRAFGRLTKLTSKLTRGQEDKRNVHVAPCSADTQAKAVFSSSYKKLGTISSSSNSIKKLKRCRCRDVSTNTGRPSLRRPPRRPKMIVTDPSGQEHKYAGFYMTILPSEQIRSLLEGMPPTKKRRHFCKCGKHYADFPSIYRHFKFIQKTNNSNQAF